MARRFKSNYTPEELELIRNSVVRDGDRSWVPRSVYESIEKNRQQARPAASNGTISARPVQNVAAPASVFGAIAPSTSRNFNYGAADLFRAQAEKQNQLQFADLNKTEAEQMLQNKTADNERNKLEQESNADSDMLDSYAKLLERLNMSRNTRIR